MASQVLSGDSNPSYTNNTGQNVRVIINYMTSRQTGSSTTNGTLTTTQSIILNWAGLSASASNSATVVTNFSIRAPSYFESGRPGPIIIGKSLATFATSGAGVVSNGAISPEPAVALPLEILLAPGQTFSAVCGIYNIVVIPENG